MFQTVGPFPPWLVLGVAVGAVLSIALAVLFWALERRFPAPAQPAGTDSDRGKRAELRAYLQAIGEPFAEDHPVAGQSVAFYLPERDVAITFDARAYFRIGHTGTHPVLVEHEMPGFQLGARLPFETPTVGESDRAADEATASAPVRRAFRELGLPAAASVDEVTTAYRRRVKEVHPDHGGDEDAFRRVREAYTTAKAAASEEAG